MTLRHTVLLVDDDTDITELLSDYLRRFGYEVLCAHDGGQMREQLARHPVDMVLLDLMLPGTDGLTLARELREHTRLPVIMLSARGGTVDRVIGLECGADDYLPKPFEPRELVARMQSVLRRARHGSATPPAQAQAPHGLGEVVLFDGWQLRRDERTLLSPAGTLVPLSNAEYRLLATFLRTPRRLCSRDQLMEQARGRALDAYDRSIDLLVSRLRTKLGDGARGGGLIKTVRGAGYMLNVASVHHRSPW
jgi:two-component system OmpR family response regulator